MSRQKQNEGLRGRMAGGVAWTVPSIVLLAIPKCPMCLVAYFAAATGFGLSMTAATCVRTGLIAASVGTLLLLSVRQVRRVMK